MTARYSRSAACALLVLFTACGGGVRDKEAPPAGVGRFPEDLANAAVEPSGVFADGWVAPAAALNLWQPGGPQVLAVRGMVPRIDDDAARTEVRVSVDGRPIGVESLGTGAFALEIPAGSTPGTHRVAIAFSRSRVLPAGDGRSVGARLAFVGFEASPRQRRPGSDIVRQGAGIRLGPGWGDLETFRNETFRWVANDAPILLSAAAAGDRRLTITAEAGPGLGGRPLVLKIVDPSGRQVDAVEFPKRGSADVFVPVEAGKETEFRLHADGGGKTIPTDPRTLNFRVLQIESR